MTVAAPRGRLARTATLALLAVGACADPTLAPDGAPSVWAAWAMCNPEARGRHLPGRSSGPRLYGASTSRRSAAASTARGVYGTRK